MYAATAQYDHSFCRYDFCISSDIVCANSEGPEQSAHRADWSGPSLFACGIFLYISLCPGCAANTDQYKLRTWIILSQQLLHRSNIIRAATAENVLRKCAPSEDSDQPAHSRSLIRNFTGRIFLTAKNAKFLHADNEDSDQPAHPHRLIWVFVGRIRRKVRFLNMRLIYSLLIDPASGHENIIDRTHDTALIKIHFIVSFWKKIVQICIDFP